MSAALSCDAPEAPAAPGFAWAGHACRFCTGRLIARDGADGGPTVFECGQCDLKAKGAPDAICGCGMLPRPAAALGRGAPASWPRWRCVPNPTRCVASPAAIVIEFGEGEKAA